MRELHPQLLSQQHSKGHSCMAQGQVAVLQGREGEPPQTGLGHLCQAGVEMLMAGQLAEAEQGSWTRMGRHLHKHCVVELGRAEKRPWRGQQWCRVSVAP
ncbi:hypothetical protein E2C01_066990 [Portunus trituberculatus]|uniref:Uncharacterized protein n=1 Tax=Portunus trituberculatus TaxID=210409 RepID=A0A5B7HVE3_PORTR|nr:hypothetical protein [Portunus trituberculatus]